MALLTVVGVSFSLKPGTSRYNVILISIDTLRADHLSCYGYERPTTPHIDGFAREARLFEQAYSQSHYTFPSHAAMFTGLFPTTLRVNEPGVDRVGLLPLNARTLGELFAARGYQTAAFTDGGLVDGTLGFARGFTRYTGAGNGQRMGMRGVVDAALGFLAEHDRARPFLLFLHTYDVHAPYAPANHAGAYQPRFVAENAYAGIFKGAIGTEAVNGIVDDIKMDRRPVAPADAEYLIAHYDSALRDVDDNISRLFDRLHRTGLDEETIVIITSDHGERFYPLPATGLDIVNRNLFAHAGSTPEILHVPLIMRIPGHAGGRVVTPVEAGVGLLPTLLDVLGWRADVPYSLDGDSLLGEARPAPVSFCFEYGFSRIADGRQLLIPWNIPDQQRFRDLREGNLRSGLPVPRFYRHELSRPVTCLQPIPADGDPDGILTSAVDRLQACARRFTPVPARFAFSEDTDGRAALAYPSFKYLFQLPGTQVDFAPLPQVATPRQLTFTVGVWSPVKLRAAEVFEYTIIVAASGRPAREYESRLLLSRLERRAEYGGYTYLIPSPATLREMIAPGREVVISLSCRLPAGSDVWCVWKDMVLHGEKASPAAADEERYRNLRALGYL